MNKSILCYRRALKKALYCSRAKRQELLEQFKISISYFLEDCPEPTYEQLIDAFGPPEEMACILMEKVSAEEKERCRKRRSVLKALAIFLVVMVVLYTVYVHFYKEYTIIEFHDELIPVQTVIAQWGY